MKIEMRNNLDDGLAVIDMTISEVTVVTSLEVGDKLIAWFDVYENYHGRPERVRTSVKASVRRLDGTLKFYMVLDTSVYGNKDCEDLGIDMRLIDRAWFIDL